MNAADISTFAHRLYEARGATAVAEAAQKAVGFEQAGDKEQARMWRKVEAVLQEMRGPPQG